MNRDVFMANRVVLLFNNAEILLIPIINSIKPIKVMLSVNQSSSNYTYLTAGVLKVSFKV